jgi:hypothetical protein
MYIDAGGNSTTKMWGTLVKVRFGKETCWVISDHQLVPGVFVKDKLRNVYLNGLAWEPVGEGDTRYHKLPAAQLSLEGISPITFSPIADGVNLTVTLAGYNPDNEKPFFTSTEGRLSDGKIVHSATTANWYCGSALIDARTNTIIGVHMGTIGPNATRGQNNFCLPLLK